MAIGTAAAILGSAVIGGIGSSIASKNSNKAINQASQVQQQTNAESNALVRDIYDQNRGVLSPYVNRGNAAGGAINSLLGLGSGAQMWGGGPAGAQITAANDGAYDPMAYAGQDYIAPSGQPNAVTPAAATPQADYQTAFDNFRNSTGYQFRTNQGMNALNSGYAARGLLNSGAAQKAALNYGQNIASAEFGNYMGYLGNQQGVGLSAGSALAGVGQNYANNISGNNQNLADNASNAALVKSQNNNALIGSLTGMAGQALGYYSSYGRR
ncbi:MAG: hypothetical protein EON59_00585 [Alphaproteobacteria bacterium]|nr:MAG: hypothetical protein EON59_00585 [Alphaproteobacteria bacterium]